MMWSSTYLTLTFAVIYAVTIILLVVAVAFFTVLERKVLAAIQRRRGPNVVGAWGLLQALSDGTKLLMKEPIFVSGANYYIFLFAPIVLLTMSLTMWIFIPLPGYGFGVNSSYSFVVVFLFSALNSYAIVLAGLASNSRFSLIGGIRAIAQLISYEIPLSVSLLTLFCIQGSYNLHSFAVSKIVYIAVSLPAIAVFAISLLAETNRTPFDLPEAEAELVAGYNLEYSSILFSLFFLAEYSNILLAASLMSLLIFNGMWFYPGVIFFCLLTIALRAILPRYTFAHLIELCWKTLFPVSLVTLLTTVTLMYIFDNYATALINDDLLNATSAEILAATATDSLNCKAAFIPALLFAVSGDKACHDAHHCSLLICSAGMSENRELFVGFKIFIFFLIALFIVCFLVLINWVIINFKSNNRKNSPYECGFEPVGSPISDFTPNFTAVALIFLIYDVEVLLTFPWAYSTAGHSASALAVFFFFICLMLLGLAYEVLDDSFNVV